ncbi:MAG: hypothetical protein ACK4IX_01760, partial [Candidatus Sericytochromatia bacterium]
GRLMFSNAKSDSGVFIWCWNTVPRYSLNHEKIILDSRSDFAHLQMSHFTALTHAFTQIIKTKKTTDSVFKNISCLVVQLHGFSNCKRSTKQGQEADVIISAGLNKSSIHWLERIVEKIQLCVKNEFKIYLFPKDVNELGATANAIGKIVNGCRHTSNDFKFIHIEMNDTFRRVMEADAQIREAFFRCLCDNMKIIDH